MFMLFYSRFLFMMHMHRRQRELSNIATGGTTNFPKECLIQHLSIYLFTHLAVQKAPITG